ncbi:MAG TPA: hypothetical protein VFO10_18660, partial [Oligoflexus sp.]|uniref:hypothetical protein n=1 Tax=Oligoflexus sp. TaxID=1971216 RepID=UPI002D80065F
MKNLWLLSVPLLSFLLTSCGTSESSRTQAYPNVTASSGMSDGDVWNQELRVLQQETPKNLNMEWFYKDFGFSDWPTRLFAEKRAANNQNGESSAAHNFLERLGQQIYQQALLADKSGDAAYANNAVTLIRRLTDSRLGFINNPNAPYDTNDNRYLEISWFLSHVARGARILDIRMGEDWKKSSDWTNVKGALNNWIGWNVNQQWNPADALTQTPLNLAAHAGTMNWVGDQDVGYGSTNRTFAMIEALLRVAELRDGRLGSTVFNPNAWQGKVEHDGSVWQLFQLFRGYLKYYFHVPLNADKNKFKLNYKRMNEGLVNANPNLLNIETCQDPAGFGYKAKCLINKDAYRNDTYHAQMGFASILHILDIAKRWGFDLTPEEHAKIIMGLRWTSFNNTPGVTGSGGAYDIPLWEV